MRVSHKGLPVSKAIVVARASLFAVNCSANLVTIAMRSSNSMFAHDSKAFRALEIAVATCAGDAVLPCQITWLRAGFNEVTSCPSPVIHWPLIS